jgi:hypothetical protein
LINRSPYPWTCPSGEGGWTAIRATAGESLRIAVGSGDEGSTGPFTLRISVEAAPTNDAFAAAQPLAGAQWETEGLAVAATSEALEPLGRRSVWFRWTPPAGDRYLLEYGGNIQVGLYTGATLGTLTAVPLSFEEPGFAWFSVSGGVEYRIAVSWSESEPYPTGGRFYVAAHNAGLTASATALDFAPQTVGTISAPRTVTLATAAGGLVTLPLTVAVRGRDEVDFLKAGDDCLNEASACTVSVRFAPSAPGPRTAVVAVGTWIGTYVVPLRGTGVAPQVPVTPIPQPGLAPASAPAPSAKSTCTVRRPNVIRCAVTRDSAANGTVTGTLRRGSAVKARATARMRAGKATVRLTSRRRLTRGRYRVTLSVSVPGAPKLALARTVRVR